MPNNVNSCKHTKQNQTDKHNIADFQTKSNKVLLMEDCLHVGKIQLCPRGRMDSLSERDS